MRYPIAVFLLFWASVSASASPARPRARVLPGGVRYVVFAVRAPGTDPHWYANFGYWSSDPNRMMYGRGGGKLLKLDLLTGRTKVLIDEPQGSVRDPAVHYDGKHILVSVRPSGSRHFNLLEIDSEGKSRRWITRGPYDDIEPTYLPNDDIVFCSSRSKRWVGCWHTQVATLHRTDRLGRVIHLISANNEHDNTPAVLPDGRLLYTRWEYVDRNQVTFHHLWTMNPDGTSQMTFFGNLHPGTVMIDARPIPGSSKVCAIFSPGHGRTEHVGTLTIVDPEAGPDDPSRAAAVPGCPRGVRDPYPLGEGLFLVARRFDLLLVDAKARRSRVLFSLSAEDRRRGLQLHEPRPLIPHSRERIIPDRVNWACSTGRLVLQDIYHGRRMEGVKRGEIKKLLVLEVLPKPVNFSGGPDLISWLGTFSLTRVVGTVPVEEDGSAYIELPALRSFFFVALDENDLSVKRMQSFVSVMPGEVTSCVGCHERRVEAPLAGAPPPKALTRPPRRPQPFEGIPDVIDFERDIQPILDQHCVRCHNFKRREGRCVLVGDRGMRFSHSWWNLLFHNQIADGGNAFGNRAPRSIGSSASALMKKIDGTHWGVRLPEKQWRTVWLWIETGAVYAGTYAALGTEQPPGRTLGPILAVLRRRCTSCHAIPGAPPAPGLIPLPEEPQHGPQWQRVVRPNDPAARRGLEILFNFTTPENSPILLGPLAEEAGGWGTCRPIGKRLKAPSEPVFADTEDPGYRAILSVIKRTKEGLERRKRFFMPGFVPNAHYLRELKRFGVLPPDFDPRREKIDCYALDQAYWRSLWYKPQVGPSAFMKPEGEPNGSAFRQPYQAQAQAQDQ